MVGNFVGPEDVADLSQTTIVKGVVFVYVSFDNSLAFSSVQ